jgi:hypothetical protein
MAVSKRTGRKSTVANDFLIPLPPGPPTANDVGTNRQFDNGAAVVEFSPVTLAVSYKISATATGQTTVTATGTSSPIIVPGLKSNVLYTFRAIGVNSDGQESDPSDPSSPTLITTVPATPNAPTAASPNANQDVVSWDTPNSGGKTITGYIWNASDGKSNISGGNPGGGPITNTSVTINQEAGTAQTYTVYAINANGTSLTSADSNSIVTTFSFTPFGFTPFGFAPFNAFNFAPFMAFMFTPFDAFSFAPFMAFMFTPFNAFGFTPMFFSFSPAPPPPMCIAAKTKVSIVDESGDVVLVSAEDLRIGDKVLCPTWSEYESAEFLDPEVKKVVYENMTDLTVKVVAIKDITSKVVQETIILNNDPGKHYSTIQPILTKKQNSSFFSWENTKDLSVGDIIMSYDPESEEYVGVFINNVELVSNVEETVYRVMPDGFLAFIAGEAICC